MSNKVKIKALKSGNHYSLPANTEEKKTAE